MKLEYFKGSYVINNFLGGIKNENVNKKIKIFLKALKIIQFFRFLAMLMDF